MKWMEDEEEAANVVREQESVSSGCEKRDSNCKYNEAEIDDIESEHSKNGEAK
jgi:hypothetical protein